MNKIWIHGMNVINTIEIDILAGIQYNNKYISGNKHIIAPMQHNDE